MGPIVYQEGFRARDDKFPFGDNADFRSTTGLVFPRDALIDINLYVDTIVDFIVLKSVSIAGGVITLNFGDSEKVRCSAVIVADAPEVVQLNTPSGVIAGLLVIDVAKVRELAVSWGSGLHIMRSMPVVVSCVASIARGGLSSLVVDSTVLTGDVWLVGEYGVVLREVASGVIRVDVVGDPLFKQKQCGGDDFDPPVPLQTINGIPPDNANGFNIMLRQRESGLLRITSTTNAVTIDAVGVSQ